ncbi:MAG: 3D domain-containing protein [Bacteroidota bacterium]
MIRKFLILTALWILIAYGVSSCKNRETHTLEVKATAYNSLPNQTHAKHPKITAWGDTLEPGMKSIAVSRDLIELGLVHGTEVSIEGLPGKYIVRDKMNRRWEKKIDIYMGTNIAKARDWGIKTVTIRWKTSPEEE